MRWYLRALEKYFVLKGRAHRKEFWMFYLFFIGFTVLLAIFFGPYGGVSGLYYLAMLIPNWTVSVRRLHDSDHSGWFGIVPFYNLYLLCIDGTRGDNKFGPDPKAGAQPGTLGRTEAPVPQVSRPDPYGSAGTRHVQPQPVDPVEPSRPGALDVHRVQKITQTQATQGGSIPVMAGSGEEVELLLPQGTTSGTHIRVPGGGARQGNQVGDLWVRIKIEGLP